MNNSKEPWQLRCAELGLDTQEVKSVSRRYDMYERFTGSQGSQVLPLDRWYKWYRIEKLSEGHAMLAPPVAGCSVGPDTVASGPAVSEEEFLQLLILYRFRGR